MGTSYGAGSVEPHITGSRVKIARSIRLSSVTITWLLRRWNRAEALPIIDPNNDEEERSQALTLASHIADDFGTIRFRTIYGHHCLESTIVLDAY